MEIIREQEKINEYTNTRFRYWMADCADERTDKDKRGNSKRKLRLWDQSTFISFSVVFISSSPSSLSRSCFSFSFTKEGRKEGFVCHLLHRLLVPELIPREGSAPPDWWGSMCDATRCDMMRFDGVDVMWCEMKWCDVIVCGLMRWSDVVLCGENHGSDSVTVNHIAVHSSSG